MSIKRYKIEDRKGLDILCLGATLVAVGLFYWIFFKTGEVLPGFMVSFTLIAITAGIILANIDVIKSAQIRKSYRNIAYLALIIYPFYMGAILWMYFMWP